MYPYYDHSMNNNPMLMQAQQRLNNAYGQAYGQPMPQQPMQMMQQQQALKGRAVTSFDEAKAAMIDLDGSVFIFPDFANKKIYTKQINLDGTASINAYSLDALPTAQVTAPQSDENAKIMNDFSNRISNLESRVAELTQVTQEVVNNVQSYESYAKNDNATVTEQPIVQESTRNGKWKR